MLDTYHFTPANNPAFIRKAENLSSDYIIYDFEESIPESNLMQAAADFPSDAVSKNSFARIPLQTSKNEEMQEDLLLRIAAKGFTKFVLPKIRKKEEILSLNTILRKQHNDFTYILLVENAECLINLKEILSESNRIKGIALGSHDYCTDMGIEHSLENLEFARQTIVHTAKAFDIKAIDIVSMDLQAQTTFAHECINGYQKGFDGKFTLHPNQIKTVRTAEYHSSEEIGKYKGILPKLAGLAEGTEATIAINGKLYECPHYMRIKKILNWYDKYGN